MSSIIPRTREKDFIIPSIYELLETYVSWKSILESCPRARNMPYDT
jgi:hypothetical protein